jgi:hypothetical protein
MPFPDDYWSTYEHEVSSLRDFLEAVLTISAYQAATDSRFVWRGATDASWPLYSSLARHLLARLGRMPTESEIRDAERAVLAEARQWALDWHATGGRLTALEVLAALQHFGGPTRLVDFSFNPLIALWFAVEKTDTVDGRVFAIDVATRLVDGVPTEARDPWWFQESKRVDQPWMTECWVWRPPPIEPRIVRQEGCFVVGGIPSTHPGRNVDRAGSRLMKADEVRQCMSVPFRLIKYDHAVAASTGTALKGTPPRARAFTLRISKKAEIRRDLERSFGYSNATLFPDMAGFHERNRLTT